MVFTEKEANSSHGGYNGSHGGYEDNLQTFFFTVIHIQV